MSPWSFSFTWYSSVIPPRCILTESVFKFSICSFERIPEKSGPPPANLQNIFFPEIIAFFDPPGNFFQGGPDWNGVLPFLPLVQFLLDMLFLKGCQFFDQIFRDIFLLGIDPCLFILDQFLIPAHFVFRSSHLE